MQVGKSWQGKRSFGSSGSKVYAPLEPEKGPDLPALGSGSLMLFGFAALNADVFLKLALGGIEGVAESDIDIFVGLLVVMFTTDHDVLLRYVQIDADMVEITLVLVVMLGFHCDFAADDVVAKLLQFRGLFADFCLDCIRMWNATKCNL